ncbi:MAG: phage tail sheath subtilisin-like domain-containing protein [Pseudomonadota bacterium]|nr:phage tail sheath subtilisin-like domain-containing protein [Pseudomonadota bacterium]
MTTYNAPGIYIQNKNSSHRSIKAVSTSTACFLGQATEGPLNEYICIASIADFNLQFGVLNTPLGIAVQQFFIHGGSRTYICRVGQLINLNELDDFFDPNKIRVKTPLTEDYLTQIEALKHLKLLPDEDINMLIFPEITWNSTEEKRIILAAIEYCEQTKNCMVIFDLPLNVDITNLRGITELQLPSTSYAAVYHPYLSIQNPNFSLEKAPSNIPQTINIPNSSSIAGLWAKNDNSRGVWKAPAGINYPLVNLTNLQVDISESQQALLNPVGINCIRNLPNHGQVVWGARTLLSELNSELHYISVRRTLNMIETSLIKGLSWTVFEPNTAILWSNIRSRISAFLAELFRNGAFQGSKANDAYFIQCGLGETMTQADIEQGNIIVIVGVAMIKPAEFSVIKSRFQVISAISKLSCK